VQSNGEAEPSELVQQACENLNHQISSISKSFDMALKKFDEDTNMPGYDQGMNMGGTNQMQMS